VASPGDRPGLLFQEQPMNLYKLYRDDFDWECVSAFIIAAESEEQARAIAAANTEYAWTERHYGGSWQLSCERGKYTARVWGITIYGRRVYRWDVIDESYSYAAAQAASIAEAKRMAEEQLRRLEAT